MALIENSDDVQLSKTVIKDSKVIIWIGQKVGSDSVQWSGWDWTEVE